MNDQRDDSLLGEEDDGFVTPVTPVTVSATGERRRRDMLSILERELRSRTRRRTVARVGTGVALLFLICGAAVYVASGRRPSSEETARPDPAPISVDRSIDKMATQSLRFEVVGNDPTVLGRYRLETRRSVAIERIGDEELEALLRAADRQIGRIQLEGHSRTFLADELALARESSPRE